MAEEVKDWLHGLRKSDPVTSRAVSAALDNLLTVGPSLGRPLVDTLTGSLPNLKELRPGARGSQEVRIIFIFDPQRHAALLVAGDKAGAWRRWYDKAIPLAEQRYTAWLADENNRPEAD